MLKRYFFFFLLLPFCLTAQSDRLYPPIFADSIIAQHQLRSITENGFGNVADTLPWWITTEIFDSKNRIIKRTTINTDMWHSEVTFAYQDKKKRIKKRSIFIDYNPSRRNTERDTVTTRSKGTYNFAGRKISWPFYKDKKKAYLENLENLIEYQYDSLGRIIEKRQQEKYGQSIIIFTYDEANQVISKKYYDHHSNQPEKEIDYIKHFEYNPLGQLTKETVYAHYANTEEGRQHNLKSITTFTYNDRGLLLEKMIADQYLHAPVKIFRKRYTYLYEFY